MESYLGVLPADACPNFLIFSICITGCTLIGDHLKNLPNPKRSWSFPLKVGRRLLCVPSLYLRQITMKTIWNCKMPILLVMCKRGLTCSYLAICYLTMKTCLISFHPYVLKDHIFGFICNNSFQASVLIINPFTKLLYYYFLLILKTSSIVTKKEIVWMRMIM